MASVKSSISLVDNISKRLRKVGQSSRKTGEDVVKMRAQIEQQVASPLPSGLQAELEAAAYLVDHLGNKHIAQSRAVANLTSEIEKERMAIEQLSQAQMRYAEHSLEAFTAKEAMGIRAQNVEKLRQNLIKAEKAEIKLRQEAERAGTAYLEIVQQAEHLANPISQSEKAQRRFNREIQQGSRNTNVLLGGLKRMFAAYLGWRGARKLFDSTIAGAAELDQQMTMLQAAFGDLEVGEAYFRRLEDAAARTGHSIDDMTEVTRNFMQLTKNTDKLETLTNLANTLSLRTQGIGSAETLMLEAIRGQYTRLQRTLSLTDSQLDPLKQAVQSRDLDQITKAFGDAFKTAGLTDEIIKAFESSPLQRFNKILQDYKNRFSHAGQNALETLMPLLDRVERWLESERATKFFNNISNGIATVAEGSVNTVDFISRNWATVESVLWAVVTVLGAVKVSTLAVNSAMNLNPFNLIIVAAIMLISWLIKLWKTNDDFAAGVYRTWNGLLNFFDRVPIFFNKVGFGIEDAFLDAKIVVFDILESMINGVVVRMNKMIDSLNKIPGVSIGAIQEVDFVTSLHLEQEALRQQRGSAISQMEADAEIKAALREQNVIEFLAKRHDPVADAIHNQTDVLDKHNLNQIDMLGDIEGNTKKLSEEDLKWLRDAAEEKAINRYTTVTQAPQMHFKFGDIHENADVDGIIDKFKDALNDVLDSGPEGVPV